MNFKLENNNEYEMGFSNISEPISNHSNIRLKVSSRNGQHFYGIPVVVSNRKKSKEARELPFALRFDYDFKAPKNELNQMFDGQFLNAKTEGLISGRYTGLKVKTVMTDKISKIVNTEWTSDTIENYVDKQLERLEHNAYQRKKRYERKIGLTPFNKFVTITNDPAKGRTDDEFKSDVLTYLNNQAVRHGWRYCGKFEHGTESTERLHFHAYMYIRDDELCSDVERVYRYNNKQRKVKLTHQHVYIAKRFGQNDFESISPLEKICSKCDDYIIKYANKDNEKMIYSRGLPSDMELVVSDCYLEAVKRCQSDTYLLFSDVVDVIEEEYDRLAEKALLHRKKAAKLAKIKEKLRRCNWF